MESDRLTPVQQGAVGADNLPRPSTTDPEAWAVQTMHSSDCRTGEAMYMPPAASLGDCECPGFNKWDAEALSVLIERIRRADAVRALCVSQIPSPDRQAAGLDAYERGTANACLMVLALLDGENVS